MTGVSTNIGATFVKPAGGIGDILKIRAVVSGMGEFCIMNISLSKKEVYTLRWQEKHWRSHE